MVLAAPPLGILWSCTTAPIVMAAAAAPHLRQNQPTQPELRQYLTSAMPRKSDENN